MNERAKASRVKKSPPKGKINGKASPQASVSVWSDRRITVFLTPKQIHELAKTHPYSPLKSCQTVARLQGELQQTQMESLHAATYRANLILATTLAKLPPEQDESDEPAISPDGAIAS